MNRLTATLALAAALLLSAAPGPGPSTYGSGNFGRWDSDPDGLPAYRYTMRSSDPRARWDPRLAPPNSLHWHQLGNSRFTANAYNLGFIKLFYGEAGLWWLNDYDPSRGEHAGGFGWLLDGATAIVDRDDLVPPGAGWERVFGVGYYLKRLTLPDLVFERRIMAPRGESSALVSSVTITNRSSQARKLTLIEYWDANRKLIPGLMPTAPARARMLDLRMRLALDPGANLLRAVSTAAPAEDEPLRPASVARSLPDLFLSSSAPVDAWITDPADLFDGPRLRRDADRLARAGSLRPPARPRGQDRLCLAGRLSFTLAPGESRTFNFFFGYVSDHAPAAMVANLRREYNDDFRRGRWTETMPGLDLPSIPWLGRELEWDYYYFLSAGLYDRYYQRHHIPQGGNYLYFTGINGATRDYAAFVQALTYYDPALAREVLELMMRAQEPTGRFFYDLEGVGRRYVIPYRPGDLDIWFLGALADYVLLTRDFAFLDLQVPFYPLGEAGAATVWEHASRSWRHLLFEVGKGEHGHPRLMLSDWNDEMTFLTSGPKLRDMWATYQKGESVMNTALALAFLPRFAELARARGETRMAEGVEDVLGFWSGRLNEAWTGDHFLRSYDGRGNPFGVDRVFLEPQAFALLAAPVFEGSNYSPLPAPRREVLIRTLRERLQAPSRLGMLIANDSADTLTTRKGEQEEGGIWLAINGPAAVGLAPYDPAMAWEEVLRNTLARHAEEYPQLWYGIWSGPDAWNAPTSDRPGETWYMKTPVANTGPQGYPVQNAHSHCQTMWAVARLAGVVPEAEGWVIEPLIPESNYSFHCALYSLTVKPDGLRGSVRLPTGGKLRLKVHLPHELDPEAMTVRVGGNELEQLEFAGEFVLIPVEGQTGETVEWRVGPME